MGGNNREGASIQAFFPPTPQHYSNKPTAGEASSDAPSGDGFTSSELHDALKPLPVSPWHPTVDYFECDIRDLDLGPRAVTFMGRVANLYEVKNQPKTPRSAKGCIKVSIKDDTGAITVRVWYADHQPLIKIGSLVSIWTTHSRKTNDKTGHRTHS